MANFTAGTSFTDGVTNDVTAAKLNALVADAVPTSNLSLNSTTGTIANFTASTANITLGTIPTLTAGTTTGTAGIFTSGTITTGLIPTLTAGTTTGTAGIFTSGTITTGLIPTLTTGTTTSTAQIVTSGTTTTLNSTTGTIATLNSTTGTIGNLSTTLAGDFTISQGTGTLGTTGATLGTYGGSTSVPVLAINAKGQVTSTGTAAISSGLTGFRNRIINGDMRIDQRNAGASSTPAGDGYFIDRYRTSFTGSTKFTVGQNLNSLTSFPSGFVNYAGLQVATAASIAAGDINTFVHYIEGTNVADLGWGTANAKTVTLSFWVRSNTTGTFGGSLQNSAQNRSYPFTYSISSANTWEQKSITIAGDTSGTWLTTTGVGICVNWSLGTGSTYSGTDGAWASSNFRSATGATSIMGSTSNVFYITGVQLEAGSTATDFERRPIGTELAMCQRYCYVQKSTQANDLLGIAQLQGTGIANGISNFPVTMRSSPTATYTAGSTFRVYTTSGFNGSAIALQLSNLWSASSQLTISGATAGHAGLFQDAGSNNSQITLNSEL